MHHMTNMHAMHMTMHYMTNMHAMTMSNLPMHYMTNMHAMPMHHMTNMHAMHMTMHHMTHPTSTHVLMHHITSTSDPTSPSHYPNNRICCHLGYTFNLGFVMGVARVRVSGRVNDMAMAPCHVHHALHPTCTFPPHSCWPPHSSCCCRVDLHVTYSLGVVRQ